MSTTTITTTTCLCTSFTYSPTFPTSSLPLPRALCLCTTCRLTTGSGGNYILLPPSSSIPSTANLIPYSPFVTQTWYFCSTCGAHVLVLRHMDQRWFLSTGGWDRTEGLIEWTGCKWVGDTLDGGCSVWFKEIMGLDGTKRDLKRWVGGDDGELVPEGTLEKLPEKKKSETLKVGCHCGGVKFYITRPNEASRAVRSPFPDLKVPHHSHSNENPKNETWWLRSGDRYLAGTCTCRSCRLASGFEIQPWAFVPKCNIFGEDGQPLDFGMGTLKRYESSVGVWREFCGKCGATVFWHCRERPELIDVSVGILDPEEGARVEGWLEWWTGRVSFKEMAVSKSLVGSLEDGLKGWKQEG